MKNLKFWSVLSVLCLGLVVIGCGAPVEEVVPVDEAVIVTPAEDVVVDEAVITEPAPTEAAPVIVTEPPMEEGAAPVAEPPKDEDSSKN